MTRARRDRVTVDLRGLRPAVEALAARHHTSLAALGRAALRALVDRSPTADTDPDTADVIPDEKIKFTVRLHRGDVEHVIAQARSLGVSYGTYLSCLIDGAPPPVIIDPGEAIAALASSTDCLTVIAADLDGLARAVEHGTLCSALDCVGPIQALSRQVDLHLELASRLMADLMPARPRRSITGKRRKERVPS